MAVRFAATGDKIARTTNIPSTANFTMAGWMRIFAAPGSNASVFCIDNGTNFKRLEVQSATSNLVYFSGGNNTQAVALKLNQWYYVACADDATLGYMYIVDPSTPGVGVFRCASTGPDVPTAVNIGGDQEAETASFDLYKPRIWDGVVLTAVQVLGESQSPTPVVTSGLNSSFDFETTTDILTDTSGNGRNMTNPSGTGAWSNQTSPTIAYPIAFKGSSLALIGGSAAITGGTVATSNVIGNFDTDALGPSEWFDPGVGTQFSRWDKEIAPFPSNSTMAGTSNGTSSASGSLTTNITAAGTSNGVATASGTLTTSIKLAGTSNGVSTATGTITTNIKLVGEADGVSTGSGTLTTNIKLAAEADGVGTATGTLTTNITLAGTANGISTAAGALTSNILLVGTSNGVANVTGALTTNILLAGTANGTSSALGTLTAGSSSMAAESDGTSTASGSLTTNIKLSGNMAAASSANGTLTTNILLAGSSVGASLAQGSLTTNITMAGTSNGVATASGALLTAIPLAGEADGTSSAAADLFISKAVSGTSSGTSTAAGTLTTNITMSGTASGTGSATATMSTNIPLAGSATGGSTATATLSTSISLAGAANALSEADADLFTNIVMAGTALGTSTAIGALFTEIDDIGLAQGTSSALGALATSILLAAASHGTSSATGDLQTSISLGTIAGESDGGSSAIGTLSTVTQFAGQAIGVSLAQALNLQTNITMTGASHGQGAAGAILLDINVNTGGSGDYGPVFKSGTAAAVTFNGNDICVLGDSSDPTGVYILKITYEGKEFFRIGELPEVRTRPAMSIHNNWIYFIGGLDLGGTATNTVWRAKLCDYKMDPVIIDTQMPTTDAGGTITFLGNHCYLFSADRTIARANVDGNGRLDSWTTRLV